jgi:hypothetical protein
MCMHDLIPMRNLLSEIWKVLNLRTWPLLLLMMLQTMLLQKCISQLYSKIIWVVSKLPQNLSSFVPEQNTSISNGITSVIKSFSQTGHSARGSP